MINQVTEENNSINFLSTEILKKPYFLILNLFLISSLILISTLEYGYLFPLFILIISFTAWSYSRPLIAVSTIVLSYIHILEQSEGISAIEVGVGIYFFGYILYWFINKIVFQGERVVTSQVDFFLMAFYLVCFASIFIIVVNYGSPAKWFRELLTFSILLLYFPVRDAAERRKNTKIILSIFLLLVMIITFYNIIHYSTATFSVKYLWQLISGRQHFGGHLFVAGVVLSASLYLHSEKVKSKLFFATVFLLSGSALVLTFSRGFWYGAIVGLFILFILSGKKLKFISSFLLVTIFVALLILFLVGGLGYSIFEAVMTRFISPKSGITDISVAERLMESKSVLATIIQNPLIGFGVGSTFKHYNIIDKVTVESLYVHNGFLYLTLKVGIIGALLLLSFYFGIIYHAFKFLRITKIDNFKRSILLAAISLFVSLLIISLSSGVFADKQALLIIALGAAFVMSKSNS